MNIFAAFPADHCRSPHRAQFFITASSYKSRFHPFPQCLPRYRHVLLRGGFYTQRRSAGRATILAYDSQGRVLTVAVARAVCVMQAGANFTHILDLTFKQQIFMILIEDYFYQNEFLKIKNYEVHG